MHQFDGGRLAQYRMRANLKQSKLAQMLETSQQSVARWENGRSEPTIRQLCALADIYGATLDELLGRDVPPHPSVELTDTPGDDIALHVSKTDLPQIAKAVQKIEAATAVLNSLLQNPTR
jgi:transcriptional regulator with XRE-family HTH domain